MIIVAYMAYSDASRASEINSKILEFVVDVLAKTKCRSTPVLLGGLNAHFLKSSCESVGEHGDDYGNDVADLLYTVIATYHLAVLDSFFPHAPSFYPPSGATPSTNDHIIMPAAVLPEVVSVETLTAVGDGL